MAQLKTAPKLILILATVGGLAYGVKVLYLDKRQPAAPVEITQPSAPQPTPTVTAAPTLAPAEPAPVPEPAAPAPSNAGIDAVLKAAGKK